VYTFYWTLAFYTPPFIAAAFYAFLNLSCPPARRLRHVLHKPAPVGTRAYASQRSSWAAPPAHAHAFAHGAETEAEPMLALVPPRGGLRPPRAPRANARRSRLAFALLVLFVYAFCALVGAVVGAVIGGYVLAGLYKAGGYHMSTYVPSRLRFVCDNEAASRWIPLVYALTHSLVGTLG
jgi:hypothetical protein